jgi:sugar transferase EpsL
VDAPALYYVRQHDRSTECPTLELLRGAGLEVEELPSSSFSRVLLRQLAERRVIVTQGRFHDLPALVASWAVGAPMRVVSNAANRLTRAFASHVSDDELLLSMLVTAAPTLTPQVGLPLLLKRGFDLSIAVPTLIAAAPVMALAGVAIRIWLGSPIVFSQDRPGRGGHIFRIFKFRTMTDERDQSGNLLPDAARLTRLGRWLRAASIDELPQLLNVVRGDMSLVGPRPLLPQYLSRYSSEQRRRHNVLPGITGLAQVNGRNASEWDERLRWDVSYADSWSLSQDLTILARTLLTVLGRRGVSQPGHVTMPEFQGTPEA